MEDPKRGLPFAVTQPPADILSGVRSEPPPLADPDEEIPIVAPGERYELRASLGEGGMGEIRLCRDRVFGREVAMKVVHASRTGSSALRARFVREARVQAQLEHPAIVPVYDFAVDPDGRAFFTMKRVRGVTLTQITERLREGDESAEREFRRHTLLTAFARVCLAIDFAHRRGVLHRDLKPDNVMLGEFGEVYVLDWGLAKLRGGTAQSSEFDTLEPGPGATGAGVVLGTPGYMAPEQLRGEPLDPRTDVYALGAILFEILTLEPLHGGESLVAIARRTLAGVDARASVRAPARDIAPELEAMCVRACALDPNGRYRTARELGDLVEAYLGGDRDIELRREAGRAHLSRAEQAAARAFAPGAPLDARAEALQEVGRALAFSPNDAAARKLLVRMLTEPPREPPKEVEASLIAKRLAVQRQSLRFAALLFMAWTIIIPLEALLGVNDWKLLFLPGLFWTFAAMVTYAVGRFEVSDRWRVLTVASAAVALGMTSVQSGPLLMLPTLVTAFVTAATLTSRRGARAYAFVAFMLAFVVPLGLVAVGMHPVKHVLDGERLTILAGAHALPQATLLGVGIFVVLFSALAVRFAIRYRDALARLELESEMQLWQLRQLAADVRTEPRLA